MDSRARHAHASRGVKRPSPLRWIPMSLPARRNGDRPRPVHVARPMSLRSILRRRGGVSPPGYRSRPRCGDALSVRRPARSCDVQQTSKGGSAHPSMISSDKEPPGRRTDLNARVRSIHQDRRGQGSECSMIRRAAGAAERRRAGVTGGPRSRRSGNDRFRDHRDPEARCDRSKPGCCGYPP